MPNDEQFPGAPEQLFLSSKARLSLLQRNLQRGDDPAAACIALGFVKPADYHSPERRNRAIARALTKLSNLKLTSYPMLKLGMATIERTFTDYTELDSKVSALIVQREKLIADGSLADDPDAFRRRLADIEEAIVAARKSAERAQPLAVNIALRQQDIIDPAPSRASIQFNANSYQLNPSQSSFIAAESARIAAALPAAAVVVDAVAVPSADNSFHASPDPSLSCRASGPNESGDA